MNFNLENKFPNLVNKQEGRKSGQKEKDFLKSLGKKAIPYIAAFTALLSSPTLLKAQDKPKTNTGVEWKLTSPDGKQVKIFNTKEERDAFAKAHNLNIPGENTITNKDKEIIPNTENGTTSKVEWKLTSPDGKQTKIFNTKEEMEEFARQHRISMPGMAAGQSASGGSGTANYQDFIKKIPPGKSTVIAIDPNNDAKIYKAVKGDKKIKLKEKGNVTVIRTQE